MEYKPEDVRSPYIIVPFLSFLIFYGITGVLDYLKNPIDNIFMILFLIWAIILCSYNIYIHFFHYYYAEVKETSMLVKNHFQKRMREINFDEIIEINAPRKWIYDVIIKDIKGNKIFLNTAIKPTDEFFNIIISRAINCKKIDLKNIKKAAPNLIMYEKGLQDSR